jgi:hypothetical protein
VAAYDDPVAQLTVVVDLAMVADPYRASCVRQELPYSGKVDDGQATVAPDDSRILVQTIGVWPLMDMDGHYASGRTNVVRSGVAMLLEETSDATSHMEVLDDGRREVAKMKVVSRMRICLSYE